MKPTHRFQELAAANARTWMAGLRFETLDHAENIADTMPQAIKLIDAEGRSCIYAPITQNGK